MDINGTLNMSNYVGADYGSSQEMIHFNMDGNRDWGLWSFNTGHLSWQSSSSAKNFEVSTTVNAANPSITVHTTDSANFGTQWLKARNVYPFVNRQGDLGSDTFRWDTIYGVVLDIANEFHSRINITSARSGYFPIITNWCNDDEAYSAIGQISWDAGTTQTTCARIQAEGEAGVGGALRILASNGTTLDSKMLINSTHTYTYTHVFPWSNSIYDLGDNTHRWGEVWCTAGVFNSSDENLKEEVR
jgi:hypothetical protein